MIPEPLPEQQKPEAVSGKEFEGHPIIQKALDDFGREVVASLQAQCEQLTRENSALRTAQDIHQRQVELEHERVRVEHSQIRADLERVTKERDEALTKIEQLQARLFDKNVEITKLVADLAAARKERDELSAEMEKIHEAIDANFELDSSVTTAADTLEDRVADLLKRLSSIKQFAEYNSMNNPVAREILKLATP